MNYWRHSLFIKLISYLILGLMIINPALALQYQQYNQTTDFISKIPDYLPKAYHIHMSQKNDVLALLKKQGYDVIQANEGDIEHFLRGQTDITNKSLQVAANFNLKSVYEKGCPPRTKTCYAEECDKYAKERRNDCVYDEPVVISKKTEPKSTSSGSISVIGNIPVPRIGGGGKDAASVLLIVIGVM